MAVVRDWKYQIGHGMVPVDYDTSDLSRGRSTPNPKARVHYVFPKTKSGTLHPGRSLCGQIPISGVTDPHEIGRWRWTEEPVDCLICLDIEGKSSKR